jgi:hypothetical protein
VKISEGDYVRVWPYRTSEISVCGIVLPESPELTHEENYYEIQFSDGHTGCYGINDLEKITKEEYLANEVLEK